MQKRILKLALQSAAAVVVAGILVAIAETPDFSQVKGSHKVTMRILLDRRDQVLNFHRPAKMPWRLDWVRLKNIPKEFADALLIMEDPRFYYHPGVNPFSVLFKGEKSITLQVYEALYPSPVSWWRKAVRIMALEMKWSKAEILEAYVNLAFFRHGYSGIGAASAGVFAKLPQDLTADEARSLALRQKSQGATPLQGRASEVFYELLEKSTGLKGRIRSNVELFWQSWAEHTILRYAPDDGAVILVDNPSGDILAMAGRVLESREAGDALKPLIFARALDERVISAAHMFVNAPSASRPDPVNLREALERKLNIPALEALDSVGVDNFVGSLHDLGFSRLLRREYYGPSLATGTAKASLREIAGAYRALAEGGLWAPLRLAPDEVSDHAAKRVFSEGTAFIISDMLPREGRARVLFGKAISVGYSEHFTLAVYGPPDMWKYLMAKLESRRLSEEPVPPTDLQHIRVQFGHTGEVRGEWFLPGTEPILALPEVEGGMLSRISYPRHRSLLHTDSWGLNPGSKTFIQVVAPKSDQNVYLNGRRLGRAQARLDWRPTAGRYRLELKNSRGQVLHRVRFEVRGRSFASAP